MSRILLLPHLLARGRKCVPRVQPDFYRGLLGQGSHHVMPRSLPALENRRAQIQQRIAQPGGLCAGSIRTTGGRCGNPRCHGRQPSDPGHGPYLRRTRKVGGQTVTETLASPAVRRKAEREIAA